MFVILGATGHVGFATAKALLNAGEPVIAVTRDATNAAQLQQFGADVAVADVHDVETMRSVFRRGKGLFLLNPPAAPDSDTDATERATVRNLLAAIDGSGLETIVAESTYGAQPGEAIGDLATLYELEEGLRAQSIRYNVIRAAYYMSNWDVVLTPAQNDGVLPTMVPEFLKIPMVAPADLGAVAARLLAAPAEHGAIHYVEGPERYAPSDVATAFAQSLGRDVRPVVTQRSEWEATFGALGFSPASARSYARMTAITVDGCFSMPSQPVRGSVTLQAYVDELVARHPRLA